jgi:hypothetical protein
LYFLAIFASALVFLAGLSVPAQAQPELDFLDESVAVKLSRLPLDAQERCRPQTSGTMDVRKAEATVFVVLNGSTEGLTDVTFDTRVQPQTGKWGDEPTHDQIDQTEVDVCWAEVKEEGDGSWGSPRSPARGSQRCGAECG